MEQIFVNICEHNIRTIFARLALDVVMVRVGGWRGTGRTGTGQREEQFKTPEKREN